MTSARIPLYFPEVETERFSYPSTHNTIHLPKDGVVPPSIRLAQSSTRTAPVIIIINKCETTTGRFSKYMFMSEPPEKGTNQEDYLCISWFNIRTFSSILDFCMSDKFLLKYSVSCCQKFSIYDCVLFCCVTIIN